MAFEGNQEFMDSLQPFAKDFPFNIRFGGNVYIRGGERYLHKTHTNTRYLPILYLPLPAIPKKTCNRILKSLINLPTLMSESHYLPFQLPLPVPDLIQRLQKPLRAIGPELTGVRLRRCSVSYTHLTLPTNREV